LLQSVDNRDADGIIGAIEHQLGGKARNLLNSLVQKLSEHLQTSRRVCRQLEPQLDSGDNSG
jgi:hypothetical protein